MSYRVYDKKKKRWVKDDIYLTPDGELLQSTKSLFGNKLTFVSQDRYVYQKAIELNDKNNVPIYIGDYLEAKVSENKTISGMVTFANELSAYIILSFDTDEYFTLGTEVCEFIEVIGNVFDDFKNGKDNGQQTL